MKRTGTLLLTLVLILACNSCTQKKMEGPITIRYVNFEYLGPQIELINQIISEFEEENPNIKIKYDYSPKPDKVLVEIAGGAAPDVFYWNEIVDLAEKKALVDLMPYVNKDNFNLDAYFPSIVRNYRYGNGLYALPFHLGPSTLVYNKDIFDHEKVPYPDESWTWDDLLDAAKRLTRDEDGDGSIGTFGIYLPPSCYAWIWMNGGRFFDKDETKCLINSRETVEAIQFFTDLTLKYKVSPTPGQVNERGAVPLFMTGKIAMTEMGAFALPELSKIKSFKWDIAPMPFPNGKKRAYFVPMGGLCMSSQSKHKEEAWKFMKFYCGKRGMSLLAKVRNCVPAMKSVAESSLFCISPPEHIRVYIEASDYAVELPRSAKFGKFIFQAFFPEIDEIFVGRKTVEKAVADMEGKGNEILREE